MRRGNLKRGLSRHFVGQLMTSPCSDLLDRWKELGLDVRIREDYLSVYDAGRGLAKLSWSVNRGVRLSLHRKYVEGTRLRGIPPSSGHDGDYPTWDMSRSVASTYISDLTEIQRNAREYARTEESWEMGLLCQNTGSPTWMLDRQVQVPGVRGRADLVGLSVDPAPPTFLVAEVKVKLDNSIQRVPDQLRRYLDILAPNGTLATDVAQSYSRVCRQLRQLDLAAPSPELLTPGMPVVGALILCEYNDRSQLLHRARRQAAKSGHRLALVRVDSRRELRIASRNLWGLL